MSTVELATSTLESDSWTTTEPGSAVRFETQCIVIPDPAYRSRRPRVVTKSYALPLWRRRSPTFPSSPPEATSFEENQSHLVLRVPLPTISLKPPSTARSVDETPLPPCLVHRPQSSGSTSSLTRHVRTPRKPSPSPSCSDVVTLPLRPCCVACQPITEAALVSGDAWPEHFSRAASRRRSLSVDSGPRTITVAGSAASASYGDLGVSISVDEMDKRRRVSDTGPSTANQKTPWSDDAKMKEECSVPSFLRRYAASNLSAGELRSPPSPARLISATPGIPEEEDDEDERELFPLPSPKRTPRTSPAPSVGSLSSFVTAYTNQSFVLSPTPSVCSGDSAGRRTNKQHLLTPPCSSSSSLSLPRLSDSRTNVLSEDIPRAPSPYLLSTHSPISGRPRSRSPSPRISFTPPTPTDALPSATDSTLPKTPQSPESAPKAKPIAIPLSPNSPQPSTSSHHSSFHTGFPWRSKRSVSENINISTPSFSHPSSHSVSSSSHTKKSLSASSPRHIIADVLRGVGAMSSGGIGTGI